MRTLVVRNRQSNSARALATALATNVNALRQGVRSLPRYDVLLNWGCSTMPIAPTDTQKVLNKPEAVAAAKDKLVSFKKFREHNVRCPDFWDNPWDAPANIILFGRETVTGSGGKGIVVMRPGDYRKEGLPLYTQYIPKEHEYRLHVVGDEVILIQQKRKENDVQQTKDQRLIRNRDNGWVFAVNNVTFFTEDHRAAAEKAAVEAVKALGLDFGAVDLVMHRDNGMPYVLEVNTAPGLESPTLIEKYATKFKEVTNVETTGR
jgi:carbamoylphosphate synthase large subunit